MSALITTKLVTPCGEITNPLAGGYIDAAGNVQGSLGFLSNKVVDAAGNLGTITSGGSENCDFDMSIIGAALPPGPWEMQLGLVETSRANNGVIGTSFPANAAAPTLSSFVSNNATGYMQGIVSGTGTWTIRSGPDTIDGVSYTGAGLLVATGANTHTGNVTMQAGTKLQFGADCTNTQTWVKGSLTIGAGATMTQYASMPTATVVAENLNNAGTYNLIGCGDCGVGGLYSTIGVTNTGATINLDKVYWRNSGIWSGIGTVNVKDGATLGLSNQPPAANTVININGCGWKDAACVEQGALRVISATTNTNVKIQVETASCIKQNSGVTSNFAGVLSGSAPLTVSNFGAVRSSIVEFSNTLNGYHGQLTFDGMRVTANNGNSMQYAKVVLTNGARMETAANTSQVVGSLASSDPTTLWQSGEPTTNTIRANGVTTYAGKLMWTGSQYAANWNLEGGSENVLTMTSTGNSGNIYPRNGAKLILQGGTFTPGQVRVQTGSTVSAGTSTTAFAEFLSIDANSALDVYASGASTGKIRVGATGLGLSANWRVNLKDPMPAGTHVIMENVGAAVTQLPLIGENLSGRTVTGFAWNNAVTPKTLSVTLA